MFNYNVFLFFIGVSIYIPFINCKAVQINSNVPRIFMGKVDTENEHRYHVAILRLKEDGSVEHICGGAILDNKHVLTAAHCIYAENKNELLVRSGWQKNGKRPYEHRQIFSQVAKMMYLKDYHYTECRQHQHDIAILQIKRSFDLADDAHFRKVELPEYNNDYEGYKVVLSGFGVDKIRIVTNKTTKTKEAKFHYPEELKYFATTVLPIEKCKKDLPIIVTNENLCTQAKNPTGFTCIGDSGSPLVRDEVIVGIRNSHNKKCIHDQPELFTRVSSYLDFIKKVLNHESSFSIVYK